MENGVFLEIKVGFSLRFLMGKKLFSNGVPVAVNLQESTCTGTGKRTSLLCEIFRTY